ncbi:OmpA family protein [Chromatocurvus halotolerans]|uniref:Outer membrane protein OmpA-like peptidoglycan-associated protein n=1 Tax=Chromatocurvus halotolerans TaxID=1132028 RepID=A0A4R2KYS0_9GAMM|nr:OmpA family protein [Chromatocurvus halotolerans]TCO78302.1 outer membrane protein OmpA-like peptidoglycan-associated protein [Chromatocurvus halotolerans]
MTVFRFFATRTTALAFSLILVACATTPDPNPALEQARTSVAAAAQDSEISRLAVVELRRAQELLESAETAWKQGATQDVVSHQAYLAERQVGIAAESARGRGLDNRVSELRSERERVQLEARAARAEREAALARADQSRAEAARLAEEAQRMRAELEASEAQALREQAQREAETARAERMMAEARAEELERETREMREQAERLQQQVADLEARPTERGLVLTLGSDVLFDVDSADLRGGAERTIEQIAAFLAEYGERQVLVEGFTDSTGARDYNLGLSERRADAVKAALIERGVEEERIRTRGFGPDYPVASNDNQSGRQLNRRVEVVISDDEQQVPERES